MADETNEQVGILQSIASMLTEIKEKLGKKEEKSPEQKAKEDAEKAQKKVNAANDKMADSLIRVGKELNAIADAGIKFANTVGVSATKGVQLELQNRTQIAQQLFSLDVNRMATLEELKTAEQSLASTFMGAAEGMEISADGVAAFSAALKGGFKSDFKLTGDAMKALITAGVSTEAGFENLRKASGRASLSNQQLATLVNKNSLSFMLYGPRFAKAAAEAEKLGISLASVQSAQESMVTNLDGTLDTLNQVNQLGAQIDFGTLTRINEFEGPQATLKYLQSTIPPSLFQSASTRALLKGFGISVEDLMKKQGSVQDQAADSIEASLTRMEEPVGIIAKALEGVSTVLAYLNRTVGNLGNSFGSLIVQIIGAAFVFKAFRAAGGTAAGLGKALLGKMIPGLGTAKDLGEMPGGTVTPPTPAGGAPAGAEGGTKFMEKIDAKKMIAGAGAMLIAAAALYVTAKAVQEFMKVDWNAMGMAGAALAGLTLSVLALGALVTNPLGATAMIAGAAAMLIIGAALYVVAKGLQVISGAMVVFAPAFQQFGQTISTMSGAQLASVGLALYPFSAGLLALGLSAPLAALGLTLLSGRLETLSTAATSIQTLATSFNTLADALERISTVDTDRLKDISKMSVTAPAITNVAVNKAGGGSNEELLRKVDELIVVLRSAKTVINVDNRIEEVPRTSTAGVYVRNQRA